MVYASPLGLLGLLVLLVIPVLPVLLVPLVRKRVMGWRGLQLYALQTPMLNKKARLLLQEHYLEMERRHKPLTAGQNTLMLIKKGWSTIKLMEK